MKYVAVRPENYKWEREKRAHCHLLAFQHFILTEELTH